MEQAADYIQRLFVDALALLGAPGPLCMLCARQSLLVYFRWTLHWIGTIVGFRQTISTSKTLRGR